MKEVRELIMTMRAERGLTVFVSSHLLSEIEILCDEVGIIQDGRKVAEGTVADLILPGETLEDCFLRVTGTGSPEVQIR
jgi:ABC-2 type transport system ATP-binding protein